MLADPQHTETTMNTYEITFEAPNGDWRWNHIEAVDFQAACENAMMSVTAIAADPSHPCHGGRLLRIEPVTLPQ
jgi:hypothetical protein